jgi:hypothetical protein
VKAVIAQKIELGIAAPHVVSVRPVHDVPKLWQEAGLPAMSNEDRRRLVKIKEILLWSGRYAAPRSDKQLTELEAEGEALKPKRPPGRLFMEEPSLLDWANFDRLYQIAHMEFWQPEKLGTLVESKSSASVRVRLPCLITKAIVTSIEFT